MKSTYLQKWYKYFNRKYFHNSLPKDLPVNYTSKFKSHQLGKLTTKQKFELNRLSSGRLEVIAYRFPFIQLNNKLKKDFCQAMITLLHEMVHLEFYLKGFKRLNHGPRFQKRMRQLASKGAFNGLW